MEQINPMQIYDFAMQGVERGRQSKLAGLISQAYGAQDAGQRRGLIGQAAGIDPGAALAADKTIGDDVHQQLVRRASMLVSAPPEMRASLYQGMPQMAAQAGLGSPPGDWDDRMLPMMERMAGAGSQTPAGMQEFNALTQGMPADDVMRARRVRLGLDGRASSAGFGFQEFEGADGRKRLGRQNPRTGQMEIYNEQTGTLDPMGGAPSMPAPGGVQLDFMPYVFDDQNMPPQVVNAIQQQESAAGNAPMGGQLPPRLNYTGGGQAGNPAFGVGRTKEEEAAAVEAAKQNVTLGNLPRQGQLEAGNAGMKAAAEAAAKAQAERDATAATKVVDANRTLSLLREAEKLIPDSTGSAVGNAADAIAAVGGKSTKGAQAIAALQTIAGQLTSSMPRMQGPQSDKDVLLYKQMAGDLANPTLPRETRMAALRTIRALNLKYANQQRSSGPRGDAKPSNRFTGFKVLD